MRSVEVLARCCCDVFLFVDHAYSFAFCRQLGGRVGGGEVVVVCWFRSEEKLGVCIKLGRRLEVSDDH